MWMDRMRVGIRHLPCREIFLLWQFLSLLRLSSPSIYSSLLKDLSASSFELSCFISNKLQIWSCCSLAASPYHLGKSPNSLMGLWDSLLSSSCFPYLGFFSYSPPLTLWHSSISSPNISSLLPLGLCTCCSLCMENYSFSLPHLCFHTCFSDLSWAFLQNPLISKSRWGAPPCALSHLCVPLL